MKVLMATDGSKQAATALAAACRILSTPDRDVDLVCVAPELGRTHSAGQTTTTSCRRAKQILERTRKALATEGVAARPVMESGSPARVLIRSSLDYDVTVIGAKSHRNGMSAGMGRPL